LENSATHDADQNAKRKSLQNGAAEKKNTPARRAARAEISSGRLKVSVIEEFMSRSSRGGPAAFAKAS